MPCAKTCQHITNHAKTAPAQNVAHNRYSQQKHLRLQGKRSAFDKTFSNTWAAGSFNCFCHCSSKCMALSNKVVLYRRKGYVQRFRAWLHIVVKGLCLDLHGLAARRGTTASKVGGLLLSEFHTWFFYRAWENNMRQTPCNVFFFVAPTVVYPHPCLHHLVAWQGSRRQRIQPESSPRSLS